jgi:ubiquinone/menaquinone biosynthesis C-methylase UbiE
MSDQRAIIDAFTELAPRYERTVDTELKLFWGWDYQGFVSYVIEQIPIKEHDLILDVATGTAVIPIKIIGEMKLESSIVGLDLTEEMLRRGYQKIREINATSGIRLTCGNGMKMPFNNSSFDIVICALATHHMDVPLMLSEMARVLKPGGCISVADVGGAAIWRKPVIRSILKLGAFIFYYLIENYSRALSESNTIPNIRTAEEWRNFLEALGFSSISIKKLPSKYKRIPTPLLINAIKK